MKDEVDVIIVGAGMIGVCTAYYLAEPGYQVTILEKDEVACGSSFGNAGLLVPSHSVPLAAPGVLWQGVKWMFDQRSPFYIKPKLDLELLSWLWRFGRAASPHRMLAGLKAIDALGAASRDLFDDMIGAEQLNCDYQRKGWLLIYRDERQLAGAVEEMELLNQYGAQAKLLNRAESLRLAPGIQEGVIGGVYYPRECHLNPALFVRQLAANLERRGVIVHPHTEVLALSDINQPLIKVTTNNGTYKAKKLVITAGAWTAGMSKKIVPRLPVQPAKGYSLSLPPRPEITEVPLYLSEAKVAVTPLSNELRLAGTLELAGMDFSINQPRVEAILFAAEKYLGVNDKLQDLTPWCGLRPCSPDGLPFIGPVPGYKDLYLSTGHCMMGITLGPGTGKLLAQLVSGKKPFIDPTPYALERYYL
jgi:D-amino-acid dehydrogenase